MDLLAVPGRAAAILPRQLAAAPLPSDQDVLAAVRSAIESGLDRSALAAIGSCRLDVVVPALTRVDPDLFIAGVPPRVRGLLAKQAIGTPIAEFTIEQVAGWAGFGPMRVVQLIGVAVGAAIQAVSRPDARLTLLDEVLAAAGDERDRGVFENDVLPLGSAVTRQELALALGIGVDRVRRLAARATQRVSVALDQAALDQAALDQAALDQGPPAIRPLVATVAERLGAVTPLGAVDRMLAELAMPPLPDTRSRLLLWMVGPYREVENHPGWAVLDQSQIGAETARLIHEDGGVRPQEHLLADLVRVGVSREHTDEWLAQQPIRVSHGLVVATTGSPGDVAERALNAQGRAMPAEELAQWLPDAGRTMQTLWTARDRRFLLTADDRLALVEWGDARDASA